MELFYRKYGTQGQPLLILHGLLGSSDNWVTIGKILGEQYQVYLIDQRNHGQSPWSDEWNYEAMSADLLEFVQTHQLENPIVVGHSMGGKVAMLFAGRYHPAKLDKLVVVDIAPKYYPLHHQAIFAGLFAIDLQSLTSRQEADAILSRHIPEADVRQFLMKNLYRNVQGGFAWRMNLSVLDRDIAKVGEAFPDNIEYVGKTLFMRGAKSNYILDEDWAMIHQYFPQAILETIENAGHWVQAEQPQAFLACLKSFLEN